jgi:hypothetical protein
MWRMTTRNALDPWNSHRFRLGYSHSWIVTPVAERTTATHKRLILVAEVASIIPGQLPHNAAATLRYPNVGTASRKGA